MNDRLSFFRRTAFGKLYNPKDTFTARKNMRGRWAMAAMGAGVARHRANTAMDQERQGYENQLDQSQRQIEAQQRQIEALQQQKFQQPPHEDITQKLQKYSDLKQKGLLTEEEFQKLKMNLLSQM
jgi:Tfp pilus assembly protein FimV